MSTFQYPAPTLEGEGDVRVIRIARHCPCSKNCSCQGLHPKEGQSVEIAVELEDADFSEESTAACACGHSWKSHGSLNRLVETEIERRARVALRADEFLDVSHSSLCYHPISYNTLNYQEAEKLDDFSFTDETIQSLRRQMELPPGEERDNSFKRRDSIDSTMSGSK
jgi:hypothetical protein